MKIQSKLSSVANKFLSSDECMYDFIESLHIQNLKISKDILGRSLKENSLVKNIRLYPALDVDGIEFSFDNVEIFVLNPSKYYLSFWSYRNFFTWDLAKLHKDCKDKKIRYVINIYYDKNNKNRIDTFNNINDFYIYNIYDKSEELRNWCDVLFMP